MLGGETPRPKRFEPAPEDLGIIPGDIRDRAMRAIGFDMPGWWYCKSVGEVGEVGDFETANQAVVE
jgi:hypothetical protein